MGFVTFARCMQSPKDTKKSVRKEKYGKWDIKQRQKSAKIKEQNKGISHTPGRAVDICFVET